MLIVSDTTPIISLIKAGQLEILRRLFGTVVIPRAVYDELVCNTQYSDEADIVTKSGFLQVASISEHPSINVLRREEGLDAGESEAIVLAGEERASLLLIDERRGRRVAEKLGLHITGTIGILLQAHDEGMITGEDVMLCLDKLKAANIRIGRALFEAVIRHIDR